MKKTNDHDSMVRRQTLRRLATLAFFCWSVLGFAPVHALVRAPQLTLSDFGQAGPSRVGALRQISFTTYAEGWSMIMLNKLDEAERLMLSTEPDVPLPLSWLIEDALAWIKFYRGDLVAGEAAFQDILARHPDAYLSRKGLGFIAVERGDYAQALEHLRASFRQNPYQLLTSYTLPGLKMIEEGEFARALESLELGLWVYPLSSDITFLMARAHIGLGDIERAAEYAMESANLAPAYIDAAFDVLGLPVEYAVDAYTALAWGLMFAGENQRSFERFQQYIDAGGDDPNAVRGRGFALFRLGRYEEALPDLASSALLEPAELGPITEEIFGPDGESMWEVRYNATTTLAWAYYFSQDSKAAAQHFEKAISDNPEWVDAHTGLGYALQQLGRLQGAAREYRTALQLMPNYPYARAGLDSLGDVDLSNGEWSNEKEQP